MLSILIIIAVFVGVAYWFVSIYNRAIALIEAVRNNQKQIDVQLDRRFKTFQSLIEIVKNVMDYEKSTLKEVIALRNQAQSAHQAGSEVERIDAENQISKILGGVSVIFEQYPSLQANKNAMKLQEEVVNTENRLSFAKQSLNDSIERYAAFKKSFFESLVVALFSEKLDRDFEYWGLSLEDVKSKEDYTVKL